MSEKITLNVCPGGGCHTGCIHKTHVKDGRIVKVERVIYPDGEEGTICGKGVAGARLPYHPDRLKYPLKRVGKRGEGKWQRITWEQALDEIADKIKKVREEYKPESVGFIAAFNSSMPASGVQNLLGFRLQNLLQATDLPRGIGIDSNPVFANFFTFGTGWATTADPRVLPQGNTKYMIIWGSNPAEMGFRVWKYIREAQKKGAKLVDIGLVFDPTAEKADWFIPVRAGSDGALALAMIDVIISENLYDKEYITRYTNGPLLVRRDNGRLLRESDITSGGDPKNYVIWDTVQGQPAALSRKSEDSSKSEPALLGTYKPGGVECQTVFQLLVDLAGQYPPERAEEITGVPAETIMKLAREYAATKPAAILHRYGLRYKNSGNAYRAMNILAAITGNIGAIGGGIIDGAETMGTFNAPAIRFNDFPIVMPAEVRTKPIPLRQSFQCMISGDPYPIKALIIYGANPLHTVPNPKRWTEKAFPNLDLIVVNDIFMTATAEYADYVLPDCTVFEREDLEIGHGGQIVFLEKAICPLYECRPPVYFWTELGKRLGFGEYFNKTLDEWMEIKLGSKDPSIAGVNPPLTLERLKKEKMVRANVPAEISPPFLNKKFGTPSGRIEFYNEELLPVNDALPVYREQKESQRSALAGKYPLLFNTANNRFFCHTLFANDPLTLKSFMSEPHLSINPKDAKKRGIAEDDVVMVYNDRGSCKVKATLSEAVPPGVVNIPHGWWPKQFIEGHLADLLLPMASQENRDEAREIFWSVLAERKGLAGLLSFQAVFADSPDTISDCLCEVKKVSV